MRISDLSVYNKYLKYDRIQQNSIQKYSNQLSSGKKILIPSDNAIDNTRSLRFKSLKSELSGYLKNMDLVQTNQEVAETTLKNIMNASEETKIDMLQLFNHGVLDSEDAQIFRDYLEDIKDYIIKQANVKIGDKYLFGGVKSQTEPFNSQGIYQGELAETSVPIAKNTEVNSTFNGMNYLGTVESGVWNDTNSDGIVDNNEISYKIGLIKAIDDTIAIIEDGDLSKLDGKISNLGYTSLDSNLISTNENAGTLTISVGDYSLSVDYDQDNTTATPTTLQELVDAINNDPTNKTSDGQNIVRAYTFLDKDGIYRLGFKPYDSQLDVSVTETGGGDILKHFGNFEYILNTYDQGYSDVSKYRSILGSQMKLIDDLRTQHENFNLNYNDLISKLEDTDFAEAIVELEKAKTAYEATMASFMQNKDLSLLNYYK